jgi:hypothetical protein
MSVSGRSLHFEPEPGESTRPERWTVGEYEYIERARKRFAAKLVGRIAEIGARLPLLAGELRQVAGVVDEVHRRVYDLAGIGPAVGFAATGNAARQCERILLQPCATNVGLPNVRWRL